LVDFRGFRLFAAAFAGARFAEGTDESIADASLVSGTSFGGPDTTWALAPLISWSVAVVIRGG
jgi:hypothetical protein